MYGEGKDMALTRFQKKLNEFDWPVVPDHSSDVTSREYREGTEDEVIEAVDLTRVSTQVSRGDMSPAMDSSGRFSKEEANEEGDISESEDVESLFSDTGLSMSSKSSMELNPVRVSGLREVTSAFLSHRDFKSLCTIAINNVEAQKSRRHIRGFLKVYAAQLCEEACSPLQYRAATFVQEAAGRIADEITWSITGFEEVKNREITSEEKPNLEKWLSTIEEGETEKPTPRPPADNDDTDEDESEDELTTDEDFPNIDALKGFLISGQAFETLLGALKDWTSLKRRPNLPTRPTASSASQRQETRHRLIYCEARANESNNFSPQSESTQARLHTEQNKFDFNRGALDPKSTMENLQSQIRGIFDFWGINFSINDLLDLLASSPPAGYERLRWRCTCNTTLSGDFPVDNTNALIQLKEELLGNLSSVPNSSRTRFLGSTITEQLSGTHSEQPSLGHRKADHTSATSNMVPAAGNASGFSFTGGQHDNSPDPTLGPSKLNSASARQPTDLTEVTFNTSKPTYFEVCTNIGNSAVGHFELDISRTTTDGEMFDKIWGVYNLNRGIGLRRLFLRPCNVHFVLFSIGAMETTRYSAGIHAKPAEYPPDWELQQRRYHYHTPKLMMPPHVFLHYLYRARLKVWGDHANDTWLKRLPKKLNESMLAVKASERDPNADLVFGWGVHILDGPNHAVLGFLLAAGLVITFAISCLVLGIAKTQEQAFGVGSYLIAIVVALMSAVYFKLQDQ
ncbi:hypothetical protein E8E14_007646 [Neopestalotiopsis sp. 37M]|nr:hypothetical protein E8E14_007646 [Neopestalotiopsis sp. 37M]